MGPGKKLDNPRRHITKGSPPRLSEIISFNYFDIYSNILLTFISMLSNKILMFPFFFFFSKKENQTCGYIRFPLHK